GCPADGRGRIPGPSEAYRDVHRARQRKIGTSRAFVADVIGEQVRARLAHGNPEANAQLRERTRKTRASGERRPWSVECLRGWSARIIDPGTKRRPAT